MKHIVVLTDFADYTHNALNYAIYIASKSKATLSIFDSSKSSSSQTFTASLFQIIENNIFSFPDFVNNYFQSLENIFSKDTLKSIHVVYKSQDEFDISEIEQNHSQNPFNLLVISTKEKKGIFNKIFRNNVSKLIEKALYPILAIPSSVQFSEIQKITFATDLITDNIHSFENIEFAYDLSISCDTKFNFVNIFKENNSDYIQKKSDFISLMQEQLGTDDFHLSNSINNSHLEGLKKYTEQNPSSILFIMKKNKSGLDKIINLGIWDDLVFSANSPILVYCDPAIKNSQIIDFLKQRKTTQ